MYLIDTNVISELRKKGRANPGVTDFFRRVAAADEPLYLSVITLGELRRGVERIRRRGDTVQAALLEQWLERVLQEYSNHILDFDADAAQIWGKLTALDPEHDIDKQIAAAALLYGLTVVTRNVTDFAGTGAKLLDPFEQG
ncbi:MAG: type II toxin-antitoxin system VapC family toxin [Rhodocyclaceae bacterium]|nr:type II toxin-antitoxin system VapC family toxin [Rhodocyclaceae bacterium]